MSNNPIILGKFYLKNGSLIERKMIFKDKTMEEIDHIIDNLIKDMEESFNNTRRFSIRFGDTVFRGDEIAAVTIKEL